MEVENIEINNETLSEQPSTQDTSPQVSTSALTTNEKRSLEISEADSSSTPCKVAKPSPRATRSSQNPDFAAKQRKFLSRVVHDPIRRDASDSENSQEANTPVPSKSPKENKSKSDRKSMSGLRRKLDRDLTPKRSAESDDEAPSKKKKVNKEPTKVTEGRDSYCFRCHKDGNVVECRFCPRVYHVKCLQMEQAPPDDWICPECFTVTSAEDCDKRSKSMQLLSVDQLCNLLRYALNRMKDHEGSEDFAKPVDINEFPNYRDYIVKPMDLSEMERNLKLKSYGSTVAFLADTKWIVHNSIIFNSAHSKFTNTARALFKRCRQEMQEIENCPDCYQNAHTRATDSWFIEACRRPHILVWAKLKGFPFWPAKAMQVNHDNQVDVRFFGAHDRAWVPLKDVFLYSKLSPAPSSNKNKRNLEVCLQELELHIKKLRDKFGRFEYAPYRTPYDPRAGDAQITIFLPKYQPVEPGKKQMRLSLHQDGARKSLQGSSAKKGGKHRQDTARKSIKPHESSSPQEKSPPLQQENPPAEPSTSGIPPAIEDQPVEDMKPNEEAFETKDSSITAFSSDESLPNSAKESPQKQTHARDESVKICGVQGTPTTSHDVTKPHKTPLTAAAKKCFAMEQKACFQCKTLETVAWSVDSAGKCLCSSCTLNPSKARAQKEKSCSKCNSISSTTWHRGQNGDFFCTDCISSQLQSSAKPVQSTTIQIKKGERARKSNTTIRGTVTVQRRVPVVQEGAEKLPEPLETTENDTTVDEQPSASRSEEGTDKTTEEGAAGDGMGVVEGEPEQRVPDASGDAPDLDFPSVDSPPKFIIPKACGSESPDSAKKVSIVDRLKEKLCLAVEEALHLSAGEESETVIDNTPEEPVLSSAQSGDATPGTELKKLQILLHDVKNNKGIMETIMERNANPSVKANKAGEMEVQSLSETGSEPDTDGSSSLESDGFANDQENNKKKKQKNINNVVNSLKERKGSVDERNDQNPKAVESSTLVLDDSSNEGPVLIIDEGESSDSKKSPGKPDKSRRKGIPAKVFSRSSTSTESSENSPPNGSSKSKQIVEVLDEVSGQFRRPSEESNLTITLVTDSVPQKKTPKEVRSVNISKSLSLSVVNDSSGLEMECVESDLDEPVIIDSVVTKVISKPTARKTLPNPVKSVIVNQLKQKSPAVIQSKSSQLEVMKVCATQNSPDPVVSPPPFVNVPQVTKVYGPSKAQGSSALPPRPSTSRGPTPVTPSTINEPQPLIGFEQVFKKVSEKLRLVMEDFLKDLMDCGNLEAKVKHLELELEKLHRRYRTEIQEIRHNSDLWKVEFKAACEADKQRALLDLKHKSEMEKEQAILETKRKQWCAFCQKEAQLYCCWNTAYCSYTCQQSHWSTHMKNCMNKDHSSPGPDVSPRAAAPGPPFNLAPGQVGYMLNNS